MELVVGQKFFGFGFNIASGYHQRPMAHIGVLEIQRIEESGNLKISATNAAGEAGQLDFPTKDFVGAVSSLEGIRPLSGASSLAKIRAILSSDHSFAAEYDPFRFRNDQQRIYSGDICEIATVYKELFSLQNLETWGADRNFQDAQSVLKLELRSIIDPISMPLAQEILRDFF